MTICNCMKPKIGGMQYKRAVYVSRIAVCWPVNRVTHKRDPQGLGEYERLVKAEKGREDMQACVMQHN